MIRPKDKERTLKATSEKQGVIYKEASKYVITLVNMCAPNRRAPECLKQIFMDIKGEINRSSVIVWDFTTSLTSMDKLSRQKINKETVSLNGTLDQVDLIDIFRAFHPKASEYT